MERYSRQIWEIREASVDPKRFAGFGLYDGYIDEYFKGDGTASEYVLFYIIDELHKKNSRLRQKLHIQKQRVKALKKKLKKAGDAG